MKWPTSVTTGFSDFSAQFTTNFVTAQALGWKKTSTSLSQEAFFKAFEYMASLGYSPEGWKQIFKVQKRLLSPCFGCSAHTF